MSERTIAVVTPAFRAERWLPEAVKSVLAQDLPHWEHWIIADDGADYEALLGAAGLADPRQRFLATGAVGGGASLARNLALDRIEAPYVAILDADDRLHPQKLAQVARGLAAHPIVSSALAVRDAEYRPLRLVGAGPDRMLTPAAHKFTCISMDSMIAWDRRRCDARYDLTLSNMTDLELLLQLWGKAATGWHLGTPLHDYIKIPSSMSNGAGFTEKMIASKRTLLGRLEGSHYSFAAPGTAEGVARFLRISLGAEASYPAALAARPGLLFEDHIEPLLAATGR